MSAFAATLFAAGVRLRNGAYDRGFIKPRRLAGPVVSIGNLSVGGSGKTPFVILLGQMLQKRGIAFDVLSRGYGRESQGVRAVDPKGFPAEFGDEPLLIARKLGVPVIVGEERYEAGLHAEREHGPRLHLLDDGFQHRRLARDFDIVLLTPGDVNDRLLPAGRLREPLRALARADAIVLSGDLDPRALPAARSEQKTWRVERRLVLPESYPVQPVAFCGIARPLRFFQQLRQAGMEPVAEAVFRDHHRYTQKDVGDLMAACCRSEANGFVTTEKDAVNLGPLAEQLQPLAIAKLETTLQESERALDFLLATVARRSPQWAAQVPAIAPLLP
jgi:tetraacyldisaccharide 4'-kinase